MLRKQGKVWGDAILAEQAAQRLASEVPICDNLAMLAKLNIGLALVAIASVAAVIGSVYASSDIEASFLERLAGFAISTGYLASAYAVCLVAALMFSRRPRASGVLLAGELVIVGLAIWVATLVMGTTDGQNGMAVFALPLMQGVVLLIALVVASLVSEPAPKA